MYNEHYVKYGGHIFAVLCVGNDEYSVDVELIVAHHQSFFKSKGQPLTIALLFKPMRAIIPVAHVPL
jgi:hypothetical protein